MRFSAARYDLWIRFCGGIYVNGQSQERTGATADFSRTKVQLTGKKLPIIETV